MMEVSILGAIRAALTLALCVAFLGLWVWAWRKERRADFDAAALLPLQDEDTIAARSDSK